MPANGKADGKRIVLGQFAGAHGVRGEFKLRSFTSDPADVAAYGSLRTGDGRTLTVRLLREVKPGLFVAKAKEIAAREDCEAFSGAELTVLRSALPAPEDEDEFYLEDLEGLEARTPEGAPAGRVRAVTDFGAGDVVELTGVPGRRGSVLLPFTKEDVPELHVAEGYLVVVLPEEAPDPDPEEDGAPASVRRNVAD
ncbi:ribosome maturation factor RimM [Parvularcula dongshanensis]|uniref:Ribosome maturation factor RimM n=1 Tax=Parvularcula dongshanensis TaxID=1173995 RepID=A0A840I047_9PROT|nr:ribosome maturation factor RimM [Parvularcula dongshanensis]MBB4658067.1 16S rRNA processing protein RimM [Parvularcula dongshanensis]